MDSSADNSINARSGSSSEPLAASIPSQSQVVVIGAGPTGLSATYHLGDKALLLEREKQVGGWCRSIQVNGFTFDYAGHIMFSKDPYVHEMYEVLLRDNVHWQDREAWIYSHNVYTRYPFQGSLYGLPSKVISECIMGAIHSRFGGPAASRQTEASSAGAQGGTQNGNRDNTIVNAVGSRVAAVAKAILSSSSSGNGSSEHEGNGKSKAASCESSEITDCCADGVMESTATLSAASPSKVVGDASSSSEPRNFEEFIYKVWGAGIAKHFAIPYNKKLWSVPLSEMETSWLGGRVPMPDLQEMIEGALEPTPKPMGPNARFGYPLRGGFQSLMNGFLPFVQDRLQTGCSVVAVSPSRRTITIDSGEELSYQCLISTMPLPLLIRAMGDEAPAEIHAAVGRLRNVSVRCVHLGVGRENLTEKHWIYYPEQTVFHRIFVQGNASPHCNPPGGFGLTCEITYSPYKPLPCDGEELIQRCIDDCRKVGIFAADDPIWAATQVDMPHAYVVYDHDRAKNVDLIREWLGRQGIILAGRYSEWEYYNSDHAFIAGKQAAEKALSLLSSPGVMQGIS